MASLLTLTFEMLDRIFKDLDGTEILLSVRDVCRTLRAVTAAYNRYTLHLNLLSKDGFHRLLVTIRAE